MSHMSLNEAVSGKIWTSKPKLIAVWIKRKKRGGKFSDIDLLIIIDSDKLAEKLKP